MSAIKTLRNALIFYSLKSASFLTYYAVSTIMLVVNPDLGRILVFMELHKPISGTIDLLSVRALSIFTRELWQQVKLIVLVILGLGFLVFHDSKAVGLIFFSYLALFYLTGRAAVLVVRGERMKISTNVKNIEFYWRLFYKALKRKSEVLLILSTVLAAISYSSFYLSVEQPRYLLVLRAFDLLGFSFSFFFQRFVLKNSALPIAVVFLMLVSGLVLVACAVSFTDYAFSIFISLRLISGYLCVKLMAINKESVVSFTTLLLSLSYWSFHLYGSSVGMPLILLTECICLAIGIYFLRKSKCVSW